MYISHVYKVISGKYGITLWVASDANIFVPATWKYTLARVMEKGRRSRAFEL
jgi:hypothetical protein